MFTSGGQHSKDPLVPSGFVLNDEVIHLLNACHQSAARLAYPPPPPQLSDTKLARKTVPENLSPVIPGEPPAFQPSHAWASRIRGAGILQGLGWSLLHHPPPPFSPRHSLSAVPSRQRGRPEPEPCWGWGGRGEVRRIVN